MPEGIGYGLKKVAGTRGASGSSIPVKGLAHQTNGTPPMSKKGKLPPSHSSPEAGAEKGGGSAPKKRPDNSRKIKPVLGGQKMREKGKGFSKL